MGKRYERSHFKSTTSVSENICFTLSLTVFFRYILGPGQTISWKAIATKGSGRDWVKWSPCWSYYRPLFRDNTINRTISLTTEQSEALVKACPKGVFDIESGHLTIARPDECDACRQCTDWASENGVPGVVQLSKRKKPEWQRFNVHSMGSLDAKDIVVRAIDIITGRLQTIINASESQLHYPSLPQKKR